MLSSGVQWNIPQFTCIFSVYTRAFRRVYILRKYKCQLGFSIVYHYLYYVVENTVADAIRCTRGAWWESRMWNRPRYNFFPLFWLAVFKFLDHTLLITLLVASSSLRAFFIFSRAVFCFAPGLTERLEEATLLHVANFFWRTIKNRRRNLSRVCIVSLNFEMYFCRVPMGMVFFCYYFR